MSIATTSATAGLWTEESSTRPDRRKIRARIGGLHCSLCTGTIEKALGRLPGVDKVAVSLTHEQALVEYDPAVTRPEELLQTLKDIGYTISDPRKLRPFEEEERELVREGRRFVAAVGLSLAAIALIAHPAGIWAGLLPASVAASLLAFVFLVLRPTGLGAAIGGAGGLAVVASVLLYLQFAGRLAAATPWIVAALAFALVFGVGRHILHMAVQALRRGILNQHVLLEIGAFAGILGGIVGLAMHPPGYPTAPFFAVAVMVATYHIFSEWLSLIVKTRSSQAVKRLLDLQPDMARVVRDGRDVDILLAEVAIGDLVRIRPGERVPVDGTVAAGHSGIDQSFVTGEPIPVEKREGDSVVGGSINGTGSLLIRVTAIGDESFLPRVVRQVEDARALKPGILHLVDHILRVYTPVVLAIAAIAFVGWMVGPLVTTGHSDLGRAAFAALSVLVMGYPCAVGISAPLSIVRGAGEAADRGILMRTGEAFQTYRLVKQIALDKTGTLTEGKPTVRAIAATGADEGELLAIAAAVESSSEHPLAAAIVQAAFACAVVPPAVEAFEGFPGQGAVARVAGRDSVVGNPRFVGARGVDLKPVADRIAALEEQGGTVIVVARDGVVLGVVSLDDPLKADAREFVAALRQAGIRTIMVTGDNERAARRVARDLGIDEVHAAMLPDAKADIVRDLQKRGKVAMVGDGINDAPALMQADVGIAMGGGTDIAIESADIIILGRRLAAILRAREISRRSYRKMVQNVALAFCFNGVGIPVAATGLIDPVWAMAAMAVSVTAIFFNSLWGRPSLFIDAILSVGRMPVASATPAAAHP
ncbi:MAG: cation-translocating P-type ATPase [Alphaproteobacteria bacterium]|nr:cation-translocating P-type ATPase [Alphaproteobacteria bacterium]